MMKNFKWSCILCKLLHNENPLTITPQLQILNIANIPTTMWLELDIQIFMGRKWDPQVAWADMCWKQVTALPGTISTNYRNKKKSRWRLIFLQPIREKETLEYFSHPKHFLHLVQYPHQSTELMPVRIAYSQT